LSQETHSVRAYQYLRNIGLISGVFFQPWNALLFTARSANRSGVSAGRPIAKPLRGSANEGFVENLIPPNRRRRPPISEADELIEIYRRSLNYEPGVSALAAARATEGTDRPRSGDEMGQHLIVRGTQQPPGTRSVGIERRRQCNPERRQTSGVFGNQADYAFHIRWFRSDRKPSDRPHGHAVRQVLTRVFGCVKKHIPRRPNRCQKTTLRPTTNQHFRRDRSPQPDAPSPPPSYTFIRDSKNALIAIER